MAVPTVNHVHTAVVQRSRWILLVFSICIAYMRFENSASVEILCHMAMLRTKIESSKATG